MNIFVPPEDPEVFEERFLDAFPKLGMKMTSNSGAFWGDGDARPSSKREDAWTFAMEAKTRTTTKKLVPRAGEWVKAMGEGDDRGQLKKFDSNAIRLFTVHSTETQLYSVSIPERDWHRLEDDGLEIISIGPDDWRYVTRRETGRHHFRYLDWRSWRATYSQITQHSLCPL